MQDEVGPVAKMLRSLHLVKGLDCTCTVFWRKFGKAVQMKLSNGIDTSA